MKRVILLTGFFLAGASNATVIGASGPSVVPVSGGWNVSYPTGVSPLTELLTGRSYVPGAVTGEAAVVDSLRLSTVKGVAGDIAVTATTRVTAAELASGAASVLGRLSLPLLAASLLYDYWTGHRVKVAPDGSVTQDLGISAGKDSISEYSSATGIWFTSSSAACTDARVKFFPDNSVFSYSSAAVDDTYWGLSCYVSSVNNITGTKTSNLQRWGISVRSTIKDNPCPSLTPGGVSPPIGSDGMCPTGNYVGRTSQQLADSLRDDLTSAKVSPATVAQSIIQDGGDIKTLAPSSLTGPASSTGIPQTTVTTSSAGSVTTVNNTPTYNYTYGSTSITYTTTNTNVTNNAGNVTTTTKTGTQSDPTDPCTLHPEVAGCMPLGTATDKVPVPQGVPIAITPVDVGMGSSGSCPADYSFFFLGRSYLISWTPTCNVVTTWVRPVVIAVAAVVAAMVFVGGLKA